MSDKWEPCPRCGSNRVRSMGLAFFILMGLGTLGFGVLFLIIPFIGIPLMVIGAAFLILAPFSKNTLQCQDCKKSWKYPANKNAVHPG